MEDLDNFRTTNRESRFKGGRLEFLNPTPMQPPVGYKPQPSLLETIREQIRAHHLANIDMDPETEDEADDFDIPDDPIDPTSPWENDHIPSLKTVKARGAALQKQIEQEEQIAAAKTGGAQAPPPSTSTQEFPGDKP